MKETVKRKIILLLYGGLALGLTRSPHGYFKIVRGMAREWKEIDRHNLHRSIKQLYEDKMISCIEHRDGTVDLVLSENGQTKALHYNIETMRIKPMSRWDKRWRVVLFDIPESFKKARDALREHLKQLGLEELQKSAFITPYECHNEIQFTIEFFEVRRHVRTMLVEHIDNEFDLKRKFNL